jgi:hypothetical protein
MPGSRFAGAILEDLADAMRFGLFVHVVYQKTGS